nr:CorA family divalent cation transporter [uncultured Oscillibacter sp.]
MVCEFQENKNGYFSDGELRMFHMAEKRIGRLNSEAQALREYGLQLRELLQAEIDICQNRIMKILTVVTSILLPLSLVTGRYGMNFVNFVNPPELAWKYGYPAVIAVSVLIVSACLWVMKKKKFW